MTLSLRAKFMSTTEQEAIGPRLSNERKFIASGIAADSAVTLLDHLLLPDGAYPVNTISSVYYDTRDFRAWAENADGDTFKHKVRLRWYSDDSPSASRDARAFIEVKFRVGSARHKTRHETRAERRWLEDAPLTDPGFLAILRDAGGDTERWLIPALVPAVVITYERRRYICPFTGGRVAVDRAIRAPRFHPDLFPLGAPVELDQTVCEFKDAAQVDIPWARHLYDAGFRLRSFSKFGESIRLLLQGGVHA